MKRTIALGVIIVSLALLALFAMNGKRPPRSIDEAGERMREAGLHVISMPHSSVTGSADPITRDQAAELTFTSDWTGKVRAWPAHFQMPEVTEMKTVTWGGVLLSGDPEIVDKLVRR